MSKYSNKVFEGFDELENSLLMGEDEERSLADIVWNYYFNDKKDRRHSIREICDKLGMDYERDFGEIDRLRKWIYTMSDSELKSYFKYIIEDSLNESSLNEKVNDSYDVKVDLAYMLSKYVEEEGLNIDFKSSDTIGISKDDQPLCDIKFVDYKTKIDESKAKDTPVNESEDNLVGKKFRCIKGIYHPNMGMLIRKGKVVNVDEDKGNEVVLNGITLYKKFLDTHFEPVASEEK